MKTPIQEHIEWLKKEWKKLESAGELGIALHIGDCIKHAESMLEKEEEVIEKAWWAGCDEGASDHKIYPSEDCNGYYNETYKTKER